MEPTFVLLPGMIGTANLFQPLLAVIPAEIRHRVICYPTDLFLDYPSVLKWIESKVADEQQMVVVGESYSGALALAFAAAHPQRVRAVILSGGYVSPPWPSWMRWLLQAVLLRIHLPSWLIRFFAAGSNASDEFVNEVRSALEQISPDVMIRRAREALVMDNSSFLMSCQVPILYLAPDRDRLVPPRNVRRIVQIRPDVKVQKLSGPHLILQTSPEAAWKAILDFLV